MKRTGLLVLAAVLAAAVIGRDPFRILPYAREIESMALMRTLGVDAAGANGVSVTASSGEQDQGAQPPEVITGQSGTISGALLSMQGSGASYVFYGHVGQLLLGENLGDFRAALDYVLRDVEMRLDTAVYIVKGNTAQAAISGVAEHGESAASRLEAMEDDAGLLSHFMPRTVREVLNDLTEQGASFAPALETDGEGKLDAAGYALLRDGALIGWADGEAARGINLYLGRTDADIFETEDAALRIVGASTKTRPVFDGDRLAGLEITCKIEANVAEAAPGLDLQDQAQVERLETELERASEARLRAALDAAQALDADYLGLERAAGLAAPWRWAAVQEQWDLPSLALDIVVKSTVERSYDVDRQSALPGYGPEMML